jgi:hypothetical protein
MLGLIQEIIGKIETGIPGLDRLRGILIQKLKPIPLWIETRTRMK